MSYKFLLFTVMSQLLVINLLGQKSTMPSVGDGSETNPYQIASLENLCWLSQNSDVWDKYFIQTADIDATETQDWNDGEGFSPIGNGTTNFTGYYNGAGYTIESLHMYKDPDNYIGLFGYISGAIIDSLGLLDFDILGYYYVGGLVGYVDGSSTINNCYCSGVLHGYSCVGGVVGSNSDSSVVTNCFSECTVRGDDSAGGLVGENRDQSALKKSFCTGSVHGNDAVGGLVGLNTGSSSITNSYNTGDIYSYTDAGGLVGFNSGSSTVANCYNTGSVSGYAIVGGCVANMYNSTITNCYSSGHVFGTYDVGGFAGNNVSSIVTNCYYDINTSGQSTDIGVDDNSQTVIGYSTAQMCLKNSFSLWDIVNDEEGNHYWRIREGKTYPALDSISNNAPFAFADTLDLEKLSCDLDTALLKNDYDYETLQTTLTYKIDTLPKTGSISSGIYTFNTSAVIGEKDSIYYRVGEVVEIGDTLWGNMAKAVFTLIAIQSLEGNGTKDDPYRISSLDDLKYLSETPGLWNKDYYFIQTADIDASETSGWNDSTGFSPIGNDSIPFSGIYNGAGYIIKSLYIYDSGNYAGLFGYLSGAEIDSLGVEDVDILGYYNVGALAGYITASTIITNCFSSGSVYGYEYAGGLVAYNSGSSSITNCYSTCTVHGTDTAGGLVGVNKGSSSIKYCYSTGSVNGDEGIGGFVGTTMRSSTIDQCYCTGSVSGYSDVGGFAGYVNASISDCYCTGSVSGYGIVGGFAAWSSSTINNSYCAGLVSGTYDIDAFLGVNYSATIINCYCNTEISGLEDAEFAVSLSTEEMQTLSTFDAWDFAGLVSDGTDDFWAICSGLNDGFPILMWQIEEPVKPEMGNISVDENNSIVKVTSNFVSLGLPNPVAYGFCYSITNSEPDVLSCDTTCIGAVNGYESAGEFTDDLTSCIVDEACYVRAYAINAVDTVYSANAIDIEPLSTNVNTEMAVRLKVYPNPTSSMLYIEGSESIVKLFNVSGELVRTHDLNESNSIDISNIEPGIYILSVDGNYVKVIKQ